MSTGLKPHWKPFVVTTTDHGWITGDKNKFLLPKKPWRPITLRKMYLAGLILATIALILVVQWLAYVSRRDQGILFAEDINDLPLNKSFGYLYLPTIMSVVYSFLWTWVDLDVKRLEPYYQLSNTAGASGRDSVLLSYPLEFLVTVPLKAFKRRHWTVFVASTASLLILCGLTPSQAGIFAVRTVNASMNTSDLRSTGYTTLSQQGNLSTIYAQSVYNIAWLNESLPPFMTRDYVLSPFGPSEDPPTWAMNISYFGQSTLYSVDISCEDVTMWSKPAGAYYNTSSGCSFMGPAYRSFGGDDVSKPFDTMYVGYQNQRGFADYYLSSYCSEQFYHYFFIRWSKANPWFIRHNNTDPLALGQANETSLFCVPTYYRQAVNATVSLPSQEVISVEPIGEKLPLQSNLFNSSTFEWAMSSGQAQFSTRSDYPVSGFPDQKSQLTNTPLNTAYIPKMAPFAIATHQRPMGDYLDSEILRTSYQSAYRLLFSRLLSDLLDRTLESRGMGAYEGRYSYVTQAVVVVPVFAWISTGILVVILTLALYLCAQCPRRKNNLESDPGTVSALLEMTAEEKDICAPFASLNHSSSEELSRALSGTRFRLSTNGQTSRLRQAHDRGKDASITAVNDANEDRPKGVRPGEMKLVSGSVFLLIQILAIIAFAVLLFKARDKDGLPLPSRSSFVRQLVEKYIPIALATFIEPFWLVLNRLLCLLQPFEELRKGNRPASKSIDLNYSWLPPHLILGRSMRAGHLILTAVCLMTLLANVLAVALGGLMYEDSAITSRSARFSTLKSSRFRELNGTGLPFNAQQAVNAQGGTTFEPFYRLMSNDTAGTPLPSWTDDNYAYVPIGLGETKGDDMIWLQTTAFGAEANCRALKTTGVDNYTMSFGVDASEAFVHTRLQTDNGTTVNCSSFAPWTRSYAESGQDYIASSSPGRQGLEINGWLSNARKHSPDDTFCRQHMLLGWIRTEWEVRKGKGAGMSIDRLPLMKLNSHNATMLVCRPSISVQTADIQVDSTGHVHRLGKTSASSNPKEQYFSSSEQDLVAQANQFFIDSDGTWHNDSYPSDFINYLIVESNNDTSLIDSSLPVPGPELAARYVTTLYRRLFALLVSTYSDVLLEDSTGGNIDVVVETPETRILLSTPAFVVAEAILACYVLVTIVFYARRPWRVLPRLPSSMASIIAYFAASEALHELSQLRTGLPQGGTRVMMSSWKWSYGTFMGRDGKEHLGIEKASLVTAVDKETLCVKRKQHDSDAMEM